MNIEFASPALLLLLPAVLALALMPLYARGWARPAGLRFGNTATARTPGRSWKLMLRPFVSALTWVALALLVIGAARPQSTEARELVSGEGVDIALALDISGSMVADDFHPDNRLQAAKQVISEFIEQRSYDRVGLVVFASQAFIHSPPTIDHEALDFLLDDIELAAKLGLEDGTAIGLGLATAANMLKDSESESRVIVLLTDGVNNKGEVDPLTAAVAAEKLGIRVYAIGMGRSADYTSGTRGVAAGRLGFQRFNLDEELLREIAELTGGQYFLATNTDGLRDIYDEISNLEKSEIEVAVYTQHQELAGWLLIPAIAFLCLELLALGTIWRSAP